MSDKLYIAIAIFYDEWSVIGVFSSKEKAEEAFKQSRFAKSEIEYTLDVEEYELDKPHETSYEFN